MGLNDMAGGYHFPELRILTAEFCGLGVPCLQQRATIGLVDRSVADMSGGYIHARILWRRSTEADRSSEIICDLVSVTSFPQCHLETVRNQKKPFWFPNASEYGVSETAFPDAEYSQEYDAVVGNRLRFFPGRERENVAQIATKLPRTGRLVDSIIPVGASARNQSSTGHLAPCAAARLGAGPCSTSGSPFFQAARTRVNVRAVRCGAITAADRERVELTARFRAVQDFLDVVSQRLAAPPMSSSTVGASRHAPEDAEAAPAAKRMRYSSSDRTGSPFFAEPSKGTVRNKRNRFLILLAFSIRLRARDHPSGATKRVRGRGYARAVRPCWRVRQSLGRTPGSPLLG